MGKIEALQKNRTWEIIEMSKRKKPFGVNEYIESSITKKI